MLDVHVPVRTCDLGGWTDTWFARSGMVCNVAVEPGIRVRVDEHDAPPGCLTFEANGSITTGRPDRAEDWPDPLAGACLASFSAGLRVTVSSGVPAGSGLGSSAAFTVAMLAAADAWRGLFVDPADIVRRAHVAETGLGRQSGVQDHAAAAFGGVRLWQVAYPAITCAGTITDEAVLAELDAHLRTVFLGQPHDSHLLHETVIARLEREPAATERSLAPLRDAAVEGFKALRVGDLAAFGVAMVANHEAQRALHRDLIDAQADHVVTLAALHGARGWKVNGAGGSGGSLAILDGPNGGFASAATYTTLGSSDGSILPLRIARRGIAVSVDGVDRPGLVGSLQRSAVTQSATTISSP